MDPWTVVTVVLVAVAVGALLPVLFQSYQTLRETRIALRRLQERLDASLREVDSVVARADRIGAAIEPHVGEVAETMSSVARLARPLREVHENLVTLATLTGALAPAARAAYRAFQDASDKEADGGPEPGDDEAAERPDG